MQQRGAALDVAEELEAEALALARALDEAGHVGDRVAGLPRLDDAEVRVQRRERVVGDLRLRGAQRGDEARLAGARVADERDIRDDLQLEEDVALPAESSEQREAGSLALGRREGRVAEAALAARGDDEAEAGLGEVDELDAVGILHDGSDRNRKDELLALVAGAVVAHARAAVAARAVRGAVVGQQGRGLRVGDEHDVAAVTAVTAVRAGERLELLAADRHAAVAAVSGTQVKRHLVDEGGHV